MSGTPEYYFQQRWMGLESLAKIIGHRDFLSKRSSVEISIGEQLQELIKVVEIVLNSSSELKNALFDNSLSEDAFHHEISALDARINDAISALKDASEEIIQMKKNISTSFANYKSYQQFNSQGGDHNSS
jgi:hypothetical protein